MQERKPENMSESEAVNLLEEELTGTYICWKKKNLQNCR
jgi:hypothetical protein